MISERRGEGTESRVLNQVHEGCSKMISKISQNLPARSKLQRRLLSNASQKSRGVFCCSAAETLFHPQPIFDGGTVQTCHTPKPTMYQITTHAKSHE